MPDFQAQIPGVGYVSETGDTQAQIPGGAYLSETTGSGGGGIVVVEEILESLANARADSPQDYTNEEADGAAATDTPLGIQISLASSSADASNTLSATEGQAAESTALLTPTLVASATTVETLTSTAEALDTLEVPPSEASSSATANATSSAIADRLTPVVDTVAAAATLVIGRTAGQTLAATAEANVEVLAVLAGVGTGTAEATATAVTAVYPRETLAASANATGTLIGSALVVLELESGAVAAGALASQLTATQNEASAAEAEAFVRLSAAEIPLYWVNTLTQAGALWTGVTFNSAVEVDGHVYVAAADGIHELVNTGGGVRARVVWDSLDFGAAELKHVETLVLDAIAAKPFTVTASTHEGRWSYKTDLARADAFRAHRAPLGRGLRATQYKFTVANSSPFELRAAQVIVAASQRRR